MFIAALGKELQKKKSESIKEMAFYFWKPEQKEICSLAGLEDNCFSTPNLFSKDKFDKQNFIKIRLEESNQEPLY